MQKVKLTKIHCTLPDEVDMDEMYLKYKGKKIWPLDRMYYRVDTGDTVQLDIIMELEDGWNEIELWDFDYLSQNDFLGTFNFKVDNTPGIYSNDMTLVEENSTASYVLDWEILKKETPELVASS